MAIKTNIRDTEYRSNLWLSGRFEDISLIDTMIYNYRDARVADMINVRNQKPYTGVTDKLANGIVVILEGMRDEFATWTPQQFLMRADGLTAKYTGLPIPEPASV